MQISNDNERQEAMTTCFNKAVLLKRTHTNLRLQNNPDKMPPTLTVTRMVFTFIILSSSADRYLPTRLKQSYSLVSPFPNKNLLSNLQSNSFCAAAVTRELAHFPQDRLWKPSFGIGEGMLKKRKIHWNKAELWSPTSVPLPTLKKEIHKWYMIS